MAGSGRPARQPAAHSGKPPAARAVTAARSGACAAQYAAVAVPMDSRRRHQGGDTVEQLQRVRRSGPTAAGAGPSVVERRRSASVSVGCAGRRVGFPSC